VVQRQNGDLLFISAENHSYLNIYKIDAKRTSLLKTTSIYCDLENGIVPRIVSRNYQDNLYILDPTTKKSIYFFTGLKEAGTFAASRVVWDFLVDGTMLYYINDTAVFRIDLSDDGREELFHESSQELLSLCAFDGILHFCSMNDEADALDLHELRMDDRSHSVKAIAWPFNPDRRVGVFPSAMTAKGMYLSPFGSLYAIRNDDFKWRFWGESQDSMESIHDIALGNNGSTLFLCSYECNLFPVIGENHITEYCTELDCLVGRIF